MVSEAQSTLKPREPRKLAIAALILAIVALLPALYFYILQFIDTATPGGLPQSQEYSLLATSLIASAARLSIAPLAAILSLIFAIISIVRSKAAARNIAIVALILLVLGLFLTTTIL